MKKLAIATMIALAATAASALELGVTGTRDYAGTNTTGYGLTVGDKAGKLGGALGFQRFDRAGDRQDRYTLVGSYDILATKNATFAVKAGGAYLNNQTSTDGYALVVGAGVSVPVSKALSVGLDVTRQYGQERVNQFDGTQVTAGLKLSFR